MIKSASITTDLSKDRNAEIIIFKFALFELNFDPDLNLDLDSYDSFIFEINNQSILELLSISSDPSMRCDIAQNLNSSIELLNRLSKDEDPDVRETARNRLIDLNHKI